MRCLKLTVIPEDVDFVLSPTTVDRVFDRMVELVDDPKQFMLFNRISIALSNLRNIDVYQMLMKFCVLRLSLTKPFQNRPTCC